MTIPTPSTVLSFKNVDSALKGIRLPRPRFPADPLTGKHNFFQVSGSAGGAVKLFDLSAGKMTRHFRGHMSNVTVIDCGSFDRRFVTTGSMDCQV